MCLDGAQWTLILTTCLESLSTCQQWCSLSHHHVLSSMQCTLCLDRTTNNHMAHLNKCSEPVSEAYRLGSRETFQSGWCRSQLSILWKTCSLLGCWTDLHHCLPESLSCHTASAQMTWGLLPATHREPKQDKTVKWAYCEMVWGADSVGIPTSFSFLMLHWREVTELGLDGGIFCLISWAAASSLPVFLLEMTTLQPKGRNNEQWKN